ncbi:TPA: hypothetical protein ACGO5P_001470 [Streptococcus suis]
MVGTVTFNQAMLAKDRVFAIRAGAYTSSDIKEASFNYGYISGDTFKPGGTVAGSAKLIFTSIITTFNKLDKIYPEIGLLVGDSYEWVAMGEYFVNDISIDRNRNTTELDLMDGMFKLNQPYISDLTYPAQIRDVIREICVKTGIELETDNLGLKAIQRHIEAKADKKDITFREVLSQAIQLLGFSAFFNRKGKLEVRGLTESRITVTADNYFLHGLTKSEIQYQIAGITCKKDKETLTVGLRTGRSLELENSFMNQNLLDELYYELKDIKYYPFSLDWQGHLKLDVGQWVTLKTNKNETYKVPVLSQSFSFKGGLKSKISADSKAGNDTQYSYKGFLTKQIEQMSTQIDAEIQQQLEYANAEFDRKTEEYKKELDDGIEQAKAEAEAYADTIKQEIDTEIAQVNQSMQAQSEEHDRQVADILAKTQSVEELANQAKSDAASAIARANQVKTEAIADARAQVATVSQALNTAKSELQTAIASTDQKVRDSQASATALRNDINLQASKILEQARAQTALTNRVTTVETLADGTRSTVAELSRTMQEATQNIASVTDRTRTVEDTLSQTRTQYENLTQTVNSQTGQIDSINRKTADLQSGIDGVTERFESLQIGGQNYFRGYKNNEEIALPAYNNVSSFIQLHDKLTYPLPEADGKTFTISFEAISPNGDTVLHIYNANGGPQYFYFSAGNIGTATTAWKKFKATVKPTTRTTYTSSTKSNRLEIYAPSKTGVKIRNIKVELGTVATDWSPAEEDLRSEIATYKRTAEESSAELSRQIQLADGKAVEAKTYAQQTADAINTRLESLETYKNEEGTRASQYLSASRTETAKQLSAERAVIATNYVAKSTYDENVRGTTLKLNEIKTTADTAKLNLATYQETVDRKLTELTSSTQTLDGKINTASAKVDTVAGQIRTEISEVEGKIPTEIGGRNYLRNSRKIIRSQQRFIEVLTWEVLAGLVGKTVTFSFDIKINPGGVSRPISVYRYQNNGISPALSSTVTPTSEWQRFSLSGIVKSNIVNPTYTKGGIGFYDWAGNNDYSIQLLKIELGTIATDWTPAPEDLATVTALHAVKDTVSSHTRTIGAIGETGSVLDNVSKVTQTAAGLVQEVSGTNGLKTQVSTLAGSWAVQNLNSDGDILSQANLSPDSFLLEAAKIRLKGKTLADEIQAIDGKFNTLFVSDGTFGKLDAKIIGARAITGDQIKFDQGFFDNFAANEAYLGQLFAKNIFSTKVQAVQLSATQLTSGIIKSFNERTTLDLLTGKLTFNDGSPSIEFNSDASAIRRVTNGQSQFIKFASYLLGTQTTIGANRKANDESIGTADFTGIQIQSRAGGVLSLIDKVYVCADEFVVDGGGTQFDGFEFKNREAIFPQSSGMLNLGRLGNRWNNVYAFDYYVGRNAVSLKEFLDAVRACFHQIAYGGMTQTTYDLIKNNLRDTFNKIQ